MPPHVKSVGVEPMSNKVKLSDHFCSYPGRSNIRTVWVSVLDGTDTTSCGTITKPCKTIRYSYLLAPHLPRARLLLKFQHVPFETSALVLWRPLSLIGHGGRVTVKYNSTFFLIPSMNVTSISISIRNITLDSSQSGVVVLSSRLKDLHVNVEGCTFQRLSGYPLLVNLDGSINTRSFISINDCVFRENVFGCIELRSGEYSTSQIDIRNSRFVRNKQTFGTGLSVRAFHKHAIYNIVINNTKFLENEAVNVGGALSFFISQRINVRFYITITSTTFIGNTAQAGGAMIIQCMETKHEYSDKPTNVVAVRVMDSYFLENKSNKGSILAMLNTRQ